MDERTIGILAGIISALSLAVQVVPEWFLKVWLNSDPQQPLPLMIGTVGETYMLYDILFRVLGPLVMVGSAVALGYTAGRRIDVVTRSRRLIRTATVGSILGVVIGWPATVILLSGSFLSPPTGDIVVISLQLLSFLPWIASISLVVTMGTLAGAALAHFSTTGETPPRPTTADTAIESPTAPETTTDHDDQHTQPTQ